MNDIWLSTLSELRRLSTNSGITAEERLGFFDAMKQIRHLSGYLLGVGFGTESIENEIAGIAQFIEDPSVVFDVGANGGQWSSLALSKFRSASIYAFEPQAHHRPNLQALVDRSAGRLTVRNAAISSQPGKATLFRDAVGSGLASLHKRDLSRHGLQFDECEEVETTSLEAEAERFGITTIDVLKVDVEGHELSVIRSLGRYLSSTSVIQFEFGGTMIDSCTFMRDFYNLLEPLGFRFCRIAPHGLVEVGVYNESIETFDISNYIAVRSGL